MAYWRPVKGHVQILDPELVSIADVERFFADERVIARGRSDDADGFLFEVAVAGRRRRVATVDDEGSVFRGRNVHDLATELQHQLRKVAVEVDDSVIHGEIDLGYVMITDEDLELPLEEDAEAKALDTEDLVSPDHPGSPVSLGPETSEANSPETGTNGPATGAEGTGSGTDDTFNDTKGTPDTSTSPMTPQTATTPLTPQTADEPEVDDRLPDWKKGPMLVLTDMVVSEVPGIVKAENLPIAVSRRDGLRILAADQPIRLSRYAFPRPSFIAALSVPTSNEGPTLFVRRDSLRETWDWSGELPILQWLAELPGSDAADSPYHFAREELGAGAIARAAVADVVAAKFSDVREALLATPEDGPRALVKAFGLDPMYSEVLAGNASIDELPGKVFHPRTSTRMFEQTFAWEMAGEGLVDEDVAGIFRKVSVDRPWLPALVAIVESTVGGVLLATGARRKPDGRLGKLSLTTGTMLVGSAIARILTTNWMVSVVERERADIERWRNRTMQEDNE